MRRKRTILILAFIIIGIYFVSTNYFPIVKSAGKRYSYNIEQSQANNVFLSEYYSLSKIDANKIKIRSSFIERQHMISNYNSNLEIDSIKSQFIISFTEKLTTLYYKEKWNVKGFGSINPYSIAKTYNCLSRDTIIVEFSFIGEGNKKIKFVKR